MTEQRGTKHGPRVDEEMAAEVEGSLRAGRSTHAQEWAEPEPSGEDQPDFDRDPSGSMTGGTNPGMTPDDVEGRSELARYLGPSVWPADAGALVETARSNNAPDSMIETLSRLDAQRTYENMQDVWSSLGGGVEDGRS